VWDFGSGAHNLVLGNGPDIVEVTCDNWMTKARSSSATTPAPGGRVPLLTRELAQCRAMAAALEEHPLAWNLLDPEHGQAEQSVYWADQRTGTQLRARLDWMYDPGTGQLIIVDYKTADSADPGKFGKACADYGYQPAARHYQRRPGRGDRGGCCFLVRAQERALLCSSTSSS